MDHAGNLGLNDGSYITLDGYDKLHFYNDIPNEEISFTTYELQRNERSYHSAINCLAKYNFVGIERKYTNAESELEIAGKKYVYENHYNNIGETDSHNEIAFLQTLSVSTISVYEQWN
ncbi:TPA: hypothetical protein RQT95_000298 [Staphylococcus aureus]|uniref:hypothetical protein n=1 Tax=Staphylococcus aureus TaxID=1280 RepID=UPI000768F547|nr:hypothetical protein [Staphylococcus aureus]MBO8572267.1 hypothetical protein [Staphylococcus aureus]MBU5048947.1 hypothetical protein [Staphylococcus aureus]CYA43468.1 Uncharacterised protein [Staphylococcus aureus]SGV58851.1 Uncharacterised protein [Staphylococcus aureus]SGX34244.1 Uncharacterised protein [Staphylococcus aureus]